jgi:hypothetical protein
MEVLGTAVELSIRTEGSGESRNPAEPAFEPTARAPLNAEPGF